MLQELPANSHCTYVYWPGPGQLAAGRPTPWLGVAEPINFEAYLLWLAALAFTLLRTEVSRTEAKSFRRSSSPQHDAFWTPRLVTPQ